MALTLLSVGCGLPTVPCKVCWALWPFILQGVVAVHNSVSYKEPDTLPTVHSVPVWSQARCSLAAEGCAPRLALLGAEHPAGRVLLQPHYTAALGGQPNRHEQPTASQRQELSTAGYWVHDYHLFLLLCKPASSRLPLDNRQQTSAHLASYTPSRRQLPHPALLAAQPPDPPHCQASIDAATASAAKPPTQCPYGVLLQHARHPAETPGAQRDSTPGKP
ncbi:hypothetical protein HaLaN_03009 [Haematococcus lacustris]|uniref:Uncharacterized protein n=1 Tax=Haematococcus lacustris TaxID=44745 RepID=A0A699YJL3_HAELA|nr:hypothetical protein HaLaN_03009 [Haematococcus lacustris]